jgi:S-adenosylmethionine:tRNA ribosyltransferase-isomerase
MPRLSDFDYILPEELIAQYPTARRGQSRLMVVDRATGEISISQFDRFASFMRAGDVLILNDTKVLPCRLMTRKSDTGAHIELLLLSELRDGTWEALVRPGRRAKVGARLSVEGTREKDEIEVVADEGAVKRLKFHARDVRKLCWRVGKVPLPPYIKRDTEPIDSERYQTVFAQCEGAAAAPTAGLHFSPEMLDNLREKGIAIEFVTLHTGLGTFQPLEHEEVEKNTLHAEYYRITRDTAQRLNESRRRAGAIFGVGTTTLRLLETIVTEEGEFRGGRGMSDIYIYPGHRFHSVDALLTNFHLPRSSLLLLVCAFGGRELILKAYNEAVGQRFRFYSYGDAMLIL